MSSPVHRVSADSRRLPEFRNPISMNYGNLFVLSVIVTGLVGCDIYLWLWLRDRDRSEPDKHRD